MYSELVAKRTPYGKKEKKPELLPLKKCLLFKYAARELPTLLTPTGVYFVRYAHTKRKQRVMYFFFILRARLMRANDKHLVTPLHLYSVTERLWHGRMRLLEM